MNTIERQICFERGKLAYRNGLPKAKTQMTEKYGEIGTVAEMLYNRGWNYQRGSGTPREE